MYIFRNILTRLVTWFSAHRTFGLLTVILLIFLCYFAYSKLNSTSSNTRYVLAQVTRETIISSISGSGQISPNDQVEIKPKASGEVIAVHVKEGQKVFAGQAIASLDASQARKAVRDAQANVESARIAYKKLILPADELSLTQTQNAVVNASTALATTYRNSINDITSTYLDLPDIVAGLQEIITGTQSNRAGLWNIDYYKNAVEPYTTKGFDYRNAAYSDFISSKSAYDQALSDFKKTSLIPSNTAQVEASLDQAYDTAQSISDAIKSIGGFVQFYVDTLKGEGQTPSSVADTQLTNIASYTSKMNAHLSALLSERNSIETGKQNITTSKQSLDKLERGAESLDIESSQLSITKAENALEDAQETLDDYTIRAPFTGTIAKLSINKGEQTSTGSIAATLITNNKIADLSLNEVDAAKISTGQKATLSFDAVEGLTIAGTVAAVDTLGTVTQGVVTYTIKIDLLSNDERIKPGMTVNASVVTAVRPDALVVPSSAVKTASGGGKYVLIASDIPTEFSPTAEGVELSTTPEQVEVRTGIFNDTAIEIISGVEEGSWIVTRTTTATASTQQSGNLLSALGVRSPGSNSTQRSTSGTSNNTRPTAMPPAF